MPLSKEYNCLFVHIPKCAGTSIEAALGMHGNLQNIGIEPYLNQVPQNDRLFGSGLQHLTAAQIRGRIGEKKYSEMFRFTSVRHPVDRFVSHVAFKMNEKGQRKWFERIAPSSDEFKVELQRLWKDKNSLKGHRAFQHTYILDSKGNSDIHFIIRYENLIDDFKSLCTMLGIQKELPHRMKSTRNSFKDYLTDSEISLVCDVYKKDMDLFDYT